jgi:DNA-binding MarR family transcriptional regulator
MPVPSDRRGIQLVPTEAGRASVGRAENALAQRMLGLVDRDMAKVVGQALSALDAALERDEKSNI